MINNGIPLEITIAHYQIRLNKRCFSEGFLMHKYMCVYVDEDWSYWKSVVLNKRQTMLCVLENV